MNDPLLSQPGSQSHTIWMVSYKGKSASKKRLRASDITEIEQGLDQVRADKIAVGGPLSEQPDHALFFVDQQGITDAGERQKLKERGLLLRKPLKIDEILGLQSRVGAIVGRKKARNGGCEKKLIAKQVKVLSSIKPKSEIKGKKCTQIADIWMDESTQSSLGKVKRPNRKAIALPSAGASYRPREKDHQKLMEQAAQVEIEKMKRAEELNRLVPPTLLTGKAISSMDLAIREILSQKQPPEEPVDNDDYKEEESVNGNDASEPKRAPVTVKKTKAVRNKEERRKQREAQRRVEEANKKEAIQLSSLKSINRQVKKELAARVEKLKRPKRRSTADKLVATIPLAVNLPEEIPDSLRCLKTEGNLIQERFNSYQKRSLIEPVAVRSRKRKPALSKIKMVVPYSHKY